jgi:uncharacterized membrane protein
LRRTTALINRSLFNAWILSAAIIAGLFFVLLYWGLFEKKSDAYRKMLHVSGAVFSGALLFYVLPNFFLYPSEFVLAGESVLSTDFLFKFSGCCAGLLLALLISLGVFKAAVQLPLGVLRLFTTLIFALNAVQHLSVIFQFLLARRIIPMVRWLFRIVAAMINNGNYFIFGAMALAFFFPLLLFIRSAKPGASWKNPAEHRKIKAAMRNSKRWSVVTALSLVLALFLLTSVKSWNERGISLSPPEPMQIVEKEIIIAVTAIEDGHLHRFAWTASDGTEVRFIVIKKGASAYGVGLDACDICGATGYYERKNEVICRLCDVVMNKSTIGFKGGCNPVPLAYSLRSGNMVVLTEDLENEKTRFK